MKLWNREWCAAAIAEGALRPLVAALRSASVRLRFYAAAPALGWLGKGVGGLRQCPALFDCNVAPSLTDLALTSEGQVHDVALKAIQTMF